MEGLRLWSGLLGVKVQGLEFTAWGMNLRAYWQYRLFACDSWGLCCTVEDKESPCSDVSQVVGFVTRA